MCCIFSEDDPEVAKEKWSSQIVQEYGSHCNGHCLYTWDRGERYLARCRHCGKLADIKFRDLTASLHEQLGDEFLYYDLKVYYLCPECRKKEDGNI